MDSSFIPPPFPFPEAWPRIFAEQQQRQERKWLTPTRFSPVQRQTPATGEYNHPLDQVIPSVATKCCDAQPDINDDDYEYEYVLSEEWRERFQSSVQLPQQAKSKKKKKPQKKIKQQRQAAINAEGVAAASASRSGHLQRELQAAKIRELARKWKRRDNVDASTTPPTDPQVKALETSLNMLFDDFCDAYQPVVWPHDSLQ